MVAQAKKLKQTTVEVVGTTDGRSVLVDKVEDVLRLFKQMRALPKGSVIMTDTETRNKYRIYDNQLLSIQFSFDGQVGHVVPFDHRKSPFNADDKLVIAKAAKNLFSKPFKNEVYWGFHHNQFDLHQIRRTFECEVTSGLNIDTEQVAYLLNENRIKGARDPECYYPDGEKGLSLAVLARVFLGMQLSEEDKKDRANIYRWPMERFVPYAGRDTWVPWRILQEQLAEAEEQGYRRALLRLVKFLFSPANLLVVEMETNGFAIDLPHVLRLQGRDSPLRAEMKRLLALLQTKKAARRANSVIVQRMARGNRALFDGDPWRFNPSKDRHRRVLFYDVLRYDPISWTDADPPKPKVDAEFYKEYGKWDKENDDEPVNEAAIVSDWVGVQKMLTSFIKNFHKLVNPDGGHPDMQPDCRVRTTTKLSSTTTGRVAAEKPAMHQIPRGTNEWRKGVKRMFTIAMGNVLICADLKANEVRWGAINAQCPDLGRMFTDGAKAQIAFRKRANALEGKHRERYKRILETRGAAKFASEDDAEKGIKKGDPLNAEARYIAKVRAHDSRVRKVLDAEKDANLRGDIHTQSASKFYGLPLDAVPKSKRQDTKSIVFGHIAARGVKAIAEQIGKTEEETAELLDEFDRTFPGLATYLKQCVWEAEHQGFVDGPQGRRRRFNEAIWSDPEEWVAAKARRQAQNNSIQGAASDACLVAAFCLLSYIRSENKSWKILNIVHDAIYIEAPLAEMAEAMQAVELCLTTWTMKWMSEKFDINFVAPLEAEIEVGHSWGDAVMWNGTTPHLEVLTRLMAAEQEQHDEKWREAA